MTDLTIADLRVEYLENPVGIDVRIPRFSWIIIGKGRNRYQTAYRIEVFDEGRESGNKIWDSGQVCSNQTTHIEYNGDPLRSRCRYYWRIQIWDEDGEVSSWTPWAFWEMGLLNMEDWNGTWIGGLSDNAADFSRKTDSKEDFDSLTPSDYFRRSFFVKKAWRRARLYMTSRGVYIARLNGERVGNSWFSPGWTDYHQRIQYQTYNVTTLLNQGENVLGVILGTGWYSGYIGWEGQNHIYGSRPLVLGQLEIEYWDGEIDRIVTDSHWKYHEGPIRYSDLLMGEFYDARRELQGWDEPGFLLTGWASVHEKDISDSRLVADCTYSVLVTEMLLPDVVSVVDEKKWMVDMGQNMVGWVKIKAIGPSGSQITLRFGEMLTEDGKLYTENLRSAKATDTYILKGDGVETFEPHFTYHGFRYVEVLLSGAQISDLVGCVVHNALPWTGEFACSHELVNRLHHNIQWGQRGNFISVPTDCPQRDERLGWLADAHIFARTAMFNMDVSSFFTKWLTDVRDAQSRKGGFPDVAPRVVDMKDGAPGWGDAGVIIPWLMYLEYGDIRILSRSYSSMEKWLTYIEKANPDYLWCNSKNNNFGDWLAVGDDTPSDIVATAFWSYDAMIMAKVSKVLGRHEDALYYGRLFDAIRRAFQTAYVLDDGVVVGDTQTAYVLALAMNLIPPSLRAQTGYHLVKNIQDHSDHLTTGFIGVGYLCPVLSDVNYDSVAYKLLLNTTYPSWGYSIEHGATTMWERWDGFTEESGFQDPGMNSFNHYAFGSIGDWLYRYVVGINTHPEYPGFKGIVIYPHIDKRLEWVKSSYRSIHGMISVHWSYIDDIFTLRVTIPPNTTAQIYVPLLTERKLFERETNNDFSIISIDKEIDGYGLVLRGSGDYTFMSK